MTFMQLIGSVTLGTIFGSALKVSTTAASCHAGEIVK